MRINKVSLRFVSSALLLSFTFLYFMLTACNAASNITKQKLSPGTAPFSLFRKNPANRGITAKEADRSQKPLQTVPTTARVTKPVDMPLIPIQPDLQNQATRLPENSNLPKATRNEKLPEKLTDNEKMPIPTNIVPHNGKSKSEIMEENNRITEILRSYAQDKKLQQKTLNLPTRTIVDIRRMDTVEAQLLRFIDDERDKVGLVPYFANPDLTMNLLRQAIYNFSFLPADKLNTGVENAVILSYSKANHAGIAELADYFIATIRNNERYRIALLGDGMDQLSLQVLVCHRQGDKLPYHYLLLAMSCNSQDKNNFQPRLPEPEIKGVYSQR